MDMVPAFSYSPLWKDVRNKALLPQGSKYHLQEKDRHSLEPMSSLLYPRRPLLKRDKTSDTIAGSQFMFPLWMILMKGLCPALTVTWYWEIPITPRSGIYYWESIKQNKAVILVWPWEPCLSLHLMFYIALLCCQPKNYNLNSCWGTSISLVTPYFCGREGLLVWAAWSMDLAYSLPPRT